MKVRELIDALYMLDERAEVLCFNGDRGVAQLGSLETGQRLSRTQGVIFPVAVFLVPRILTPIDNDNKRATGSSDSSDTDEKLPF